MEWVLQVVDEFDDAVGAIRHGCMGVKADVGLLLGGTFGFLTNVGAALKGSVRRSRTGA